MTEIIESQTAIAEYSPLAAGLAQLQARYAGVVFDCRTSEGDAQARKARKELVSLRTTLEDKRKELKAPALERSRLIDSEAKRIESLIRQVELPIDEQIRAVEAEKEAERQRRLQEIAARVAEQRRQIIAAFAMPPPRDKRYSSEELKAHRAKLVRQTTAEFGDLQIEAEETRARALDWLDSSIADAMRYEIEQAQIARERAEMAEQRAKEAAERREAEAKAQRERDAAAAQQRAEEEARRAELQAAEERLAAERARLDEQRRALEERQEQERLALERRQREEDEALERQQRELRAAEERDVRQAGRVRLHAQEMLDCLLAWKAAEERHNSDEMIAKHAEARTQRDHLIEILTPQPATEAP